MFLAGHTVAIVAFCIMKNNVFTNDWAVFRYHDNCNIQLQRGFIMTQQNLTVGGTVLAVKSETLIRALLSI